MRGGVVNPLENGNAGKPIIQLIDFVDLARDPRRIKTMRHGDALAVIGERDVRVAERTRALRHGFDRGGAVGPVG